MRFWLFSLVFTALVALAAPCAFARPTGPDLCPRPPAGSAISEPEDLRSHDGVLKVDLRYVNFVDANGQSRYCYLYKDGGADQAPTLRVHPGDWLVLTLKNDLQPLSEPAQTRSSGMPMNMVMSVQDPCAQKDMTGWSTNLHFHGLTVPPVCHQDDVLRTMISPGDPPFEYRMQIPADEPPGVYWYHPHVHGLSNAQVLGGASGALIVEGIERANPALAGMPERLLIVRDQELLHPDAAPSKSAGPQGPPLLDAEGDVMNTGTDGGKPAKDLSVNFVPVPYPDYSPAVVEIKPGERQLWRILNASAITYIDLEILAGGNLQPMGVASLDGAPVNENGKSGNGILWRRNLLLPPAGRADFVFTGPPAGVPASLITRRVDTGPAGENDPTRPLATIVSKADAPEPPSTLAMSAGPPAVHISAGLGDVKPVRERKLYFSERLSDPHDPNSGTVFFITVDGQEPVLYDPRSTVPDIVARQGDVEDWIIENRSQELHAFHIHQIHFLLTGWNGVPVDEPFLRDTVNVPYWDGTSPVYPSVRLRMDFRDPNTVGTFVYHCHLLEHEDGGMMGTIRVERPAKPSRHPS